MYVKTDHQPIASEAKSGIAELHRLAKQPFNVL